MIIITITISIFSAPERPRWSCWTRTRRPTCGPLGSLGSRTRPADPAILICIIIIIIIIIIIVIFVVIIIIIIIIISIIIAAVSTARCTLRGVPAVDLQPLCCKPVLPKSSSVVARGMLRVKTSFC